HWAGSRSPDVRARRRSGSYTVFFFSSRRRHTRLVSDWSSDVCSSDLVNGGDEGWVSVRKATVMAHMDDDERAIILDLAASVEKRSEERRVGKECRSRWGADN